MQLQIYACIRQVSWIWMKATQYWNSIFAGCLQLAQLDLLRILQAFSLNELQGFKDQQTLPSSLEMEWGPNHWKSIHLLSQHDCAVVLWVIRIVKGFPCKHGNSTICCSINFPIGPTSVRVCAVFLMTHPGEAHNCRKRSGTPHTVLKQAAAQG